MGKLLSDLLGEARGNATWDAIKAWGWPAVLSLITWMAAWFKKAPLWQIYVAVSFVCLISYAVAFFLYRRRGKTKSIDSPLLPRPNHQKVFTEMVDRIKAQKPAKTGQMAIDYSRSLRPINPIGELIKASNEIQTEDELKWFCAEFERCGYEQPLKHFQAVMGDGFGWLPVLKEARHRPEEINTDAAFLSFLALTWSGKENWKEANRKKNSMLVGTAAIPNHELVKPLEITAKIFHPHVGALIAGLEIKNPNQAISGFAINLAEMEPNLLPSSVYLRQIPFPPIGSSGGIINSGQTVRADIFLLTKMSPEQAEIMFVASYDDKGRIAATWKVVPKDMTITLEITAYGLPMQTEKFRVIFSKDGKEPVFTFKKCAQKGYKKAIKL